MSQATVDRIMRGVLRKRPMTETQLELARREIERLVAEFLEQPKSNASAAR
jgi:hypothetical protein